MEYRNVDNTRLIATVFPAKDDLPTLSYSKRLERWAAVLEEYDGEGLQPLQGTEFVFGKHRQALREANSPLSVAFADAVLRAHGLGDDTYGEAKRFFGLSDATLHRMICHCHYVSSKIPPTAAALQIRGAARRAQKVERLTSALRLNGTWLDTALCRSFA